MREGCCKRPAALLSADGRLFAGQRFSFDSLQVHPDIAHRVMLNKFDAETGGHMAVILAHDAMRGMW